MKVQINSAALEKIREHSASSDQEVAGLLIGQFKDDVLVITQVATGSQIGTAASVELSADVQGQLAEKLIEGNENQSIVGWYHSHPRLGVFMSGTDVRTQTNYQAYFPHAVGLVIDPSKSDFKVFQVSDGRYHELVTETVRNDTEIAKKLTSEQKD